METSAVVIPVVTGAAFPRLAGQYGVRFGVRLSAAFHSVFEKAAEERERRTSRHCATGLRVHREHDSVETHDRQIVVTV